MSMILPVMYHWSPKENRSKIAKRGLKATCPTLVEKFATKGEGPRKFLRIEGTETVRAVCLGTSPSHAWSLCGALWGERGEVWDLWQVLLDAEDELKILPSDNGGNRLGEVRVLGSIPKSRVWHVGERVVGRQKWSIDSQSGA